MCKVQSTASFASCPLTVELACRITSCPGFVFPGKPGTACVEGTAAAVSEFGKSLRSLQWQKLGSRHIDRFPQLRDAAELEALRRFARPMVELGGEATAVGGSLHSDQVRAPIINRILNA